MSEEESCMNIRLGESCLQMYERALVISPANTARTCKSKQIEFKKWCEDQAFSDLTRFTVIGPKLHQFLNQFVIGDQNDIKRKKRKMFADRGSDALLDGYTTNDQIPCISTYFWTAGRDYGTNIISV
ncbi:Hypothetical protein PHPALM_37275 [Phytophthora palmivora]|uniref:Uncharacterized protein n=1 Tax=Phytophthora palmivora TaxID=4796 RepID=A0A2P4WXU9_9STRA|nr:Hypothetical protein PHPALM_37275 [Phytophthora palmivora]